MRSRVPRCVRLWGLALGAVALLVAAACRRGGAQGEPGGAAGTSTDAGEAAHLDEAARRRPEHHRAVVERDAAALGVELPGPDRLARPLAYHDELAAPRALRPREVVTTPHLSLRAVVRKQWAENALGGYGTEHLLLEITNRGDGWLAYRVLTEIDDPRACQRKGALPHDALVIGPRETLVRSECLWHPRRRLRLLRVEVMELTELGFHYVSRLGPSADLHGVRTSAGHRARGRLAPCRISPYTELGLISDRGASWADVVDFYARHSCDEYHFPRGYRRRTSPGPLPAVR